MISQRSWTTTQIRWLKDNADSYSGHYDRFVAAFNERFGTSRTSEAIRAEMRRSGVKFRRFSRDQEIFLYERLGYDSAYVTEAFNKIFREQLSIHTIRNKMIQLKANQHRERI